MSVLSSLMGNMQAGGASDAAAQAAASAAGAAGQAGTQAAQAIKIPPTPYDDAVGTPDFWLPMDASALTSGNVDWLYHFLLWLSLVCFVGITFAVIYFTWKYRERPGHKKPLPSPHHNNPLEITWTIIPAMICVFLFVAGWRGYIDNSTPPQNTWDVSITGLKWKWKVVYPNGYEDPNGELHVPVDTPVRLVMTSVDVIHSFYIPVFRIKKDVVPRRYTQLWFKASDTGVFRVFCTEYCGLEHSMMKTLVVVHDKEDYQAYLDKVALFWETGLTPSERGKKVYDNYCIACHNLDKTTKVGPGFGDIAFGGEHEIVGQPNVLVDENYIRESLIEPAAKIRKGYPGGMTSFKGLLSDRQIDGVIAFLKELNGASGQAPTP